MAKLSFFGAAGTVTGSRHFLEVGGHRLLIDAGLFQGRKVNRLKNWDSFPVDPGLIDRVLLTHAHIDHTGYLPKLVKEGFSGMVHCTHATRDLCEILLRDSAYLQTEEANWANKKGYSKHKPALPLYEVQHAEDALAMFQPVNFGERLMIGDSLRVRYKNAGHILGAAMIDVKNEADKRLPKILFSGDIGRAEELILRDPVQSFNVDYLVLESTYGNRPHEMTESPYEQLSRVIIESVNRKGVLLIPSFSVGRTQTLLYIIRQLEESGVIPTQQVFIDSPMAIDATRIFNQRIVDLNLKTRIETLKGLNVFKPSKLKICKSRHESKAINEVKSGAIIISASGMATGGRILHHLIHRLPDERNTVLFVGYQAEGTRGRTILDGDEKVKIFGRHVPIKAQVSSISGFSGHADYFEILAWLMAFNRPPKETFLVHGEPEASAALKEKIESKFGWKVTVPAFGDSAEIDLGD